MEASCDISQIVDLFQMSYQWLEFWTQSEIAAWHKYRSNGKIEKEIVVYVLLQCIEQNVAPTNFWRYFEKVRPQHSEQGIVD